MAQARRKRQTKHRGNAAGIVEARGRTGRKPTSAEKRGPLAGRTASRGRDHRFDKAPTWRGAFVRAMAAAIVMLLLSIVILKKANQAIALFPLVLILYVPISYYTDLWLYRRRQASKLQRAGKPSAERPPGKPSEGRSGKPSAEGSAK